MCVFYLTVSQVSLQLGDFLPQLLQLLLAGLHLLPLFSLLLLPLLLQPLDDSLLGIRKEEEREERGMEVRKMETEGVQELFTVTQYQVSILITVALNFMYMAGLTGSNSQQ